MMVKEMNGPGVVILQQRRYSRVQIPLRGVRSKGCREHWVDDIKIRMS